MRKIVVGEASEVIRCVIECGKRELLAQCNQYRSTKENGKEAGPR